MQGEFEGCSIHVCARQPLMSGSYASGRPTSHASMSRSLAKPGIYYHTTPLAFTPYMNTCVDGTPASEPSSASTTTSSDVSWPTLTPV